MSNSFSVEKFLSKSNRNGSGETESVAERGSSVDRERSRTFRRSLRLTCSQWMSWSSCHHVVVILMLYFLIDISINVCSGSHLCALHPVACQYPSSAACILCALPPWSRGTDRHVMALIPVHHHSSAHTLSHRSAECNQQCLDVVDSH